MLEEFEGAHAGETVLALGNGISLGNVPVKFLRSMPSFGVNHIIWHNHLLDQFQPTYWVGLDPPVIDELVLTMNGVIKFVPDDLADGIIADDVVSFRFSRRIKGLPYSHKNYVSYSSSLLAAVHLFLYMGVKTVLVVGFDCTAPVESNRGNPEGKNGAPHFYDKEVEGKYHSGWDRQMGALYRHATALGADIINLSDPTECTTLPRMGWEEWS